MTDRRKKAYRTGGAVLLAVILAYGCRLVGKGTFYPTLFSYLRSFIYIGLYAAWGLAAAARIKARFPHIKVVVVTSLVDPAVLAEAKAGGADSLWYKDHGTAELLDVVRRTLAGERVFPETAPAVEMEGVMSDKFSPRQMDILRWYIRGLTYGEIADKLGISKNGVRWNLDDMVEKGGFESREALVATAIENKLMVTTLKNE